MPRLASQKGQATLEYLGVLVVVAALAGGMLSMAPGVAGAVEQTLCSVIGGSCGADGATPPPANEERPVADAIEERICSMIGISCAPAATPGAVDEAQVDDALARVHSALDTGGWSVTASDLDAIRDAFAGLSTDEREALVMRMSDRDLETWGDQMNESGRKGGWSIGERDAFFSGLLAQLSPAAIERLASTNPYLRPKHDGERNYGEPDYVTEPGRFNPSPDDIDQGSTGDCYFLAALGSVAQANPGLVRDMVRRNANGTYTVTFHQRGRWDARSDTFDVTVIPEFVNGLNETPANDDRFYMQIIEKAWAQHGEGYDKVQDSRPGIALEILTGHEASSSAVTFLGNFDPIAAALRDGRAVTATTDVLNNNWIDARLPGGGTTRMEISTSHVFIVREVRPDGMIVLRNPWGGTDAEIMLTVDEFRSNFSRYTEVPG